MTAYLSACGGGSNSNTAPASTTTTPSASTSSQALTASVTTATSTGTLTITGQPQLSISLGAAYYFNANTTGTTKTVTFSIQNKPSWATFNTLTGELSGTPNEVATFSNIGISASDGQSTAKMKSFSIVVTDAGATNNVVATVSWTAPTSNTDGSTFNNPSGFVIHYGASSTALNKSVTIGSSTARSYNLAGLSKGSTYYFAVAAINTMNMEGELSAIKSITL